MTFSLVIQAEAADDLQQAYEWYNLQQPGLGERFLKEISSCLDAISEYHTNYSFFSGKYRCKKAKHFPYLVLYEIEDLNIIIVRILNAKRKFVK